MKRKVGLFWFSQIQLNEWTFKCSKQCFKWLILPQIPTISTPKNTYSHAHVPLKGFSLSCSALHWHSITFTSGWDPIWHRGTSDSLQTEDRVTLSGGIFPTERIPCERLLLQWKPPSWPQRIMTHRIMSMQFVYKQ